MILPACKMFKLNFLIFFLFFFLVIDCQISFQDDSDAPVKENLFRMSIINNLWKKAQYRLSDVKLQNLWKDLKQQDKDELLYKKLKSEGQDKHGLMAMKVRLNLNAILTKYDIKDIFDDFKENNLVGDNPVSNENDAYKITFKDRNLDLLWRKAQNGHFTEQELNFLYDEFKDHEQKISDYHKIVDKIHDLHDEIYEKKNNMANEIHQNEDVNAEISNTSEHYMKLREKHKQIKDHYITLKDKVLKKLDNNNEFFEDDDVNILWEAALKSGLDKNELAELKTELNHFEQRILKLKYYTDESFMDGLKAETSERGKEDKLLSKNLKTKIKDLSAQISKLRNGIEKKILRKHEEL